MKKLPVEYVKARKEYILFSNDCGVSDMAKKGGVYEWYIFEYIKNNLKVEGTTIIDIGANFGHHSLEFADFVGDAGRVIAFEPQRLVYYQLCGNIVLNGYDNIVAHNIALSDEQTQLKMENPVYSAKHTINIGDSHLGVFGHSNFNIVEVNTLDSFNFENVSIIKIDVQGLEPKVLDGAVNTINKNRPIIFIEVETPQLNVYGWKDDDVFIRLKNLGYSYTKVLDAPHLVDYIALPIE